MAVMSGSAETALMTATFARVFERKEANNARIRANRAARRSVLFLVSLVTGAVSLLSPIASK
ncbi:MAG TPA: hypothetical protein VNY08_06525 [Bradyrhizobium sp.]|nr:hypothetical protein [Bradyrhizobium sp.]